MTGEEFPIKNNKSAQTCYARYWRCEDYSCPLHFHCSAGLIHEMSDNEIKLQFERKD